MKREQRKLEISARQNVRFDVLAREMEYLFYREPIYHPTRWYTLPGPYNGHYVNLDKDGLRINRELIRPNSPKVICFGGSTMFSTTTDDKGSIPYHLQEIFQNDYAVLNYGMGGYSSYAEIGAFMEAIRKEENICCALFYDGVNEVAMFVEMLQFRMNQTFYEYVGWPFSAVTHAALRNFIISDIRVRGRYRGVLQRIKRVLARQFLNSGTSIDGVVTTEWELHRHAQKIASNYLENVKTISAIANEYGIPCLFVWQPDIFISRKLLTPEEAAIQSAPDTKIVKKLSILTYHHLFNDQRAKKYRIIDGTSWLNSLKGEHFYDYCHVSSEANQVIASWLAKHVVPLISKGRIYETPAL